MVLLSIDFANLHTILETLYGEMMPLCKDMMDVGKGLAGLGALFYVAIRVWQSMARAEPIDVYPLLRPFAIGICILLFPTLVLGTLNSVLSPIVQGTHKMLEGRRWTWNSTVPKGGAGTGSHAAQSRDRPSGERRGVRPAAGRAGLVAHGRRLAAGHVR